MEIQLTKFDMNKIKDDKVVVLIGKRNTGKSFLCKDILFHHRYTFVDKSFREQKLRMSFIQV